MKKVLLLLLSFSLMFLEGAIGQDLHTQSNAASVANETNTTTGWSGTAVISSDNSNPQLGNFAIRMVSNTGNRYRMDYFYNATVGTDYVIRIWARQGPQVTLPAAPAFANWSGMSGFSTTPITSSNWTEYVFNVTATSSNPRITIYNGTSSSGNTAGNTVFIDNVSILPAGSDTAPPTAPTNLAASGTTSTGTTLNWTASTDNVGVTGYTILQNGTSIGTTNGATTFNVTGLFQNTSYAFTVTARDAAGNISPASNTANVTTQAGADNQPPTAPSNLAANGTTTTTTNLSWAASTDNVGVTGYTILQNGTSIGTTTGALTFNVTGLTQNTSYAFTVTARDAAGNVSPASNTANVTTLTAADNQPPTAPSNLAANGTTTTATNLSWAASTDNVGVTGYTIWQNGTSIGTTTGALTFNVTGLTQNTSYAFTVTATDAAGNVSPASNTANVTTLTAADNQPPTAPTNLAANGTTTTATNLSWAASTDNVGVTGYTILQNGTSIGTTTGALTFNVTGLTQNTSYAFTVTARDAAGNISPVSNTANVTTLTAADGQAPTAPSNLTASGTTNTTTNLAWTASTDNVAVTGYNILQNGTSVGTTTGALTFNVTGLTQNTAYAFTVTAIDAAGNVSPASNTANVTTTGGGIIDYTSVNSNLPTVDWTARDLFASRNVGIGTTNTQGYRLAVDGNVVAEEIRVELSQNWPDFVFTKSYGLPTLEEVEQHILDKGHLQNIPSAMEVELNGIMLGEMNAKLLQKIEELTLYAIQQEKKIMKLENENKKIQLLSEKLLELEGLIKGNN